VRIFSNNSFKKKLMKTKQRRNKWRKNVKKRTITPLSKDKLKDFMDDLYKSISKDFNNVTSTKHDLIGLTCVRDEEIPYVGTSNYFVSNELKIILFPIRDGICLFKIEVFKHRQGIGTNLITKINDISWDNKIPIYLIPVSMDDELLNDKQLKRWYHSLGYKRTNDSLYWGNRVDWNKRQTTNLKIHKITNVKNYKEVG